MKSEYDLSEMKARRNPYAFKLKSLSVAEISALKRCECLKEEEAAFLSFLSQDIADHPSRLQALDAHFVAHLKSLVSNMSTDLNTPLLEKDE